MKTFALCCFLALPLLASTQHRFDYQWPFGYGPSLPDGFGISKLDFTGGAVEVYPYRDNENFKMPRGSAFLCDGQGELMLMTNNCEVVDADFATIARGDTITPGETYDIHCQYGYYPGGHCVLLLPDMERDSVVHMVHKNLVLALEDLQAVIATRLYLSTIVRRADGTFYVQEKRRLLLDVDQIGGQLTAVLSADGARWWVWSLEYGTNRFHKFLVGGPEGAQGPFVQEVGPALVLLDVDVGQAAFSPDGQWLGINSRTQGALLYGFDPATGELSAPEALPYPGMEHARGLSFSHSSRFLYVTGSDNLYQFDLQAEGAVADAEFLGRLRGEETDTGWPIGAGYLHLGPDCRMYISPRTTSRILHVVHYPDRKGLAAGAERNAIRTPTRVNFNLPNMPMFRFGGSCDSTIAWGIPTAAVEPLPLAEEVRLFPNPALGWTYLELPEGHAWAWAAVFNAQGQELRRTALSPGQRQAELSTEGWTPGLYFLRIGPGGGGPVLKLMVGG